MRNSVSIRPSIGQESACSLLHVSNGHKDKLKEGFAKLRGRDLSLLSLSEAEDISTVCPILTLSHELSPWMVERLRGEKFSTNRLELEREAVSKFHDLFERSIFADDADEFISTIRAIAQDVRKEDTLVRRGRIFLAPDASGEAVEFPHPVDAIGTLKMAHGFVRAHYKSNAPASAILMLLSILNAHILEDGNGRAARCCFNIVMNMGGRAESFLPIYELSARSAGGFQIAVRQAEIHGDWTGIVRWISAAVDYCNSCE